MRNYIFSALLFVCLFSGLVFGIGGDMGGSGQDGSADWPYLIEDFNDFEEFCGNSSYWASGVYTRLECDLDLDPNLSGRQIYSQAPVAGDTDTDSGFDGVEFAGVFDGNGHVISNLVIDGVYYCGLFGKCGDGSEIKNFGLENVSITGPDGYVASLVSCNERGSITSCYSTGAINGGDYSDYVGGLVGFNDDGSITSCYFTGEVNGDDWVGSLVGWNWRGSITSCYSTSAVTGDYRVGGLVGENWCGSITSCYSTGAVTGDYRVGGLVGDNDNSIIGCYSTGEVTGNDDYVSGLVGKNDEGSITSCYSTGEITGNDYVGGLVGWNYEGSITSCYSTGEVTGNDYVGGLGGWNWYGSITSCFWDVNTSGMADPEAGSADSDGMIGLETTEMQTQSTFTNAGWDFIGESINGPNDIWRMCTDGVDYPKFGWEFARNGDIACSDGIDIDDLKVLATNWLNDEQQTNFYGLADINADGIINFADFVVLADNWLIVFE